MKVLHLAVFALACLCSAARAQSKTDWLLLQQVPAGRAIQVRSEHGKTLCTFNAVDDASLTCTEHRSVFFVPHSHTMSFTRLEVRSVRLSSRVSSTVIGSLLGAAAGGGLGSAIDASATSPEDGHLATGALTLFGIFIGAAIGNHTDFLPGQIVYKVP